MSRAVKMIADRTWLICEEIAPGQSVYMYLLAGDQEALLIDTGFGTIPLREITRELTALLMVLLTHGHFDHIGAAAQFDTLLLHEDDLECYRLHTEKAFRKQFGLENEFVHPKYEPQLINSSWTKDLGNRLISIIHTPGHTPGSICILDETNHVLYTADSACRADVLLNLKYACSVETYRNSIRTLLDLSSKFDITWPAHHNVPVGKEILQQFLEASELLLSGKAKGQPIQVLGSIDYRLSYGDIGIIYSEPENP